MSDPGEEWRDLPSEYGPYRVSSHGRVFSRLSSKIMRPEISKSGHRRVNLYTSPGRPRRFQVHRLVARAFIGESSLDVLHWDDDPGNNKVENLRYGTDAENYADSIRNGIRKDPKECPRGHPYEEGNLVRLQEGDSRKRCVTCELRSDREKYRYRVSKGLSDDDPRHGTYAGYRAGCRKDCCYQANSRYKSEYYQRKKQEGGVR